MTVDQTAVDEALRRRSAVAPSNRQRLFIRYFTAILIDLVVLNLCDEYLDTVSIDSFSTSLLAAVLLQALLRLTIVIEHLVAVYFQARRGGLMKFMRYFGAWLVLFGSKFIILEALTFAFGDAVRFDGAFHGILTLVGVILAMIVAEEAIIRLYRALGDGST